MMVTNESVRFYLAQPSDRLLKPKHVFAVGGELLDKRSRQFRLVRVEPQGSALKAIESHPAAEYSVWSLVSTEECSAAKPDVNRAEERRRDRRPNHCQVQRHQPSNVQS